MQALEDKKARKRARRLLRRIGECEPKIPDEIKIGGRGESIYDLALEAELRSELLCAFYFLLTSAKLGYPRAQFRVAQCYEKGTGTKKSAESSVKWYEQAAKNGHVEATIKLGDCYRIGFGVERDYGKCMEAYRAAADTEDARALCILADSLFEGKLCTRDMPRAVRLYQQSALKAYPPAVHKINEIFDKFTKIFNSAVEAQRSGDDVTAVRLYTIAAEMGHRSSACNLGYCYQNGVGCKKDMKRAVHYYTIAAEDGSATAKFNLGMCYKQGGGVNVDFRKAEKLLEESKDGGFSYDADRLLEEIASRRKRKKARAIYSASTAVYRRGEIQKAIKMRIEAAKMGSARAEYLLGCHVEFGDGLPKDAQKAKYYYKKAKEHGFRDVMYDMKKGFLRERRLLDFRK